MNKKNNIAKIILEYIFPNRCPICNDISEQKNQNICMECREKSIYYVKNPKCKKCGKEIIDKKIEICMDCSNIPKTFDKGFPLLVYKGDIVDTLYGVKYKNKRQSGIFLGREIARRYKKEFFELGIEVIVPIPLNKTKTKKRGYNQSLVIAKGIFEETNIEIDNKVLIRKEKTKPQKNLSTEERINNLKNAFISSCNRVKYKKILLVDDIYTTGATIEASTLLLKELGVEEVYYTSVCIGQREI